MAWVPDLGAATPPSAPTSNWVPDTGAATTPTSNWVPDTGSAEGPGVSLRPPSMPALGDPPPNPDLATIVAPGPAPGRTLPPMDQIPSVSVTPGAPEPPPGMLQPPPYTATTEPPTERPGILAGLQSGITRAITEGNQLVAGQGFVPQPYTPEPEPTFGGKIAEGLSHSAPMLGAGMLGAAGGTAMGGPVGGLVGGALGAGGMAGIQALVPAYQEARRAGLNHEAAVDRALTSGAVQGGTAALMGGAAGLAPFRSVIGNILLQVAGVQPAIGAAGRSVEALATGQPQPTLGEFAEGAASDVITGGMFAGAHAGGRALMRDRPMQFGVTPERGSPPERPTLTGEPADQTATQPPPGARWVPDREPPQQELLAPAPVAEPTPAPVPGQVAPSVAAPPALAAPAGGTSPSSPPVPQPGPASPPVPAGAPLPLPAPASPAAPVAPATAPAPAADPVPSVSTSQEAPPPAPPAAPASPPATGQADQTPKPVEPADTAPASPPLPASAEPRPAPPETVEPTQTSQPPAQQETQQPVTEEPTKTTAEPTTTPVVAAQEPTAATAKDPAQQPELDRVIAQRDKLQATIDTLQAVTPNAKQASTLRAAENQMAKLNQRYDALVGQPGAGVLERRHPRGGVEPKVPGTPATQDQLLKGLEGASPYQNVFADAGIDPAAAVNWPHARQINAIARQMKTMFDFKAVEVVPGWKPPELIDVMMNIYRNGQMMMAVLGRPQSLMGMGRVTLRLEPGMTKGNNVMGSYNLVTHTLTLKGRLQTLGHEWAHAEDRFLFDRLTSAGATRAITPMVTAQARDVGMPALFSVPQAIGNVVNHLFFDHADLALKHMQLEREAEQRTSTGAPTARALQAQDELDALLGGASDLPAKSIYRQLSEATQNPGYWASVWELWARAREMHIAHKLAAEGIDPTGVVMTDAAYQSQLHQQMMVLYPQAEERVGIIHAFDALDAALEREAAHGPRGAKSADAGANVWLAAQKSKGWPTLSASLKQTLANLADYKSRVRELVPFDRTRPANERGLMTQVQDIGRGLFHTKGTLVEIAAERARHPRAAAIVQTIRDKMGPRYGSRRPVAEGFEERQKFYSHEMLRDYTELLRNTDMKLEDMPPAKQVQIDDALTSGDITGLTPNEKQFVTRMRYLLNQAYHRLKGAGYDVQALSQYRPRIYDFPQIAGDGPGFIRAAADLYKRMFDAEINNPKAPGSHGETLVRKYASLSQAARATAPQQVKDLIKQIRSNLTAQRRIERLIAADPSKAVALAPKLVQLKADADALAAQLHDPMGEWISDNSAADWHMRIVSTEPHDFEQTGPGGNWLAHRELPPIADKLLKKWMVHDIQIWAPTYFLGVAKAQAKAEVWGSNWEKLEELIRAAMDAGHRQTGTTGLLTGDDGIIREAVKRSVESHVPYQRRSVANWVNVVQGLGALTMLARTPITVLSEFSVGAMAHNDVRVAGRNFVNMISQFLRTASAQDVTDFANWMGITTTTFQNSAMLDRYMSDFSTTPSFAKWMDTFYRMSGMTGLTRVNQRAAMETSHWLAHTYAVKLTQGTANQKDDAVGWFNDHGVPEQWRDAYAQWMLDHEQLSTIDRNDQMMDIHRLVLKRATEQQVLTSNRTNTPLHAENWLGRLPMQFYNYAYQFQKQILDAVAEQGHYKGRRAYGQSRAGGAGKFRANMAGAAAGTAHWAQFAAVVAGATMAQLLTTVLREFLFNQAGWEKHTEDDDLYPWLLGLAFTRTGVGGTLDPITQLITGLRYTADISSLLEGAAINSLQRNTMDLFAPFLKEETETNSLRYAQNRALYNIFIAPTIAFAATALGHASAPLGYALGYPLLTYGTSRDAADKFATMMQGPKGARPEPDDEGAMPKLPKLGEDDAMPKLPKLGEDEAAGDKSGTGVAGMIPLGLVDDFVLPIYQRVVAPMIAAMPVPVKAAVSTFAGAAVGYEWWKSGEPTRGQPAPPPPKRPQ